MWRAERCSSEKSVWSPVLSSLDLVFFWLTRHSAMYFFAIGAAHRTTWNSRSSSSRNTFVFAWICLSMLKTNSIQRCSKFSNRKFLMVHIAELRGIFTLRLTMDPTPLHHSCNSSASVAAMVCLSFELQHNMNCVAFDLLPTCRPPGESIQPKLDDQLRYPPKWHRWILK